MKSLPNALSLSRVPLGVAVAITAVGGHWLAAFVLLLLGCVTDVADGEIARRYGLASKFGADVLEPYCDLALTAGALAGLLFTGYLDPRLLAVAVALYVPLMIRANFGTGPWRRLSEGFLPFYYLGVLIALVVTYAYLALPRPGSIGFTALLVPILTALAYYKRRRLLVWIRPS